MKNMEPANNASLNTSMETHKSSDIGSLIRRVKIGWVPFLNLDPELANNTRVLSLNTSMETNKSFLDGRSLMDGGQNIIRGVCILYSIST